MIKQVLIVFQVLSGCLLIASILLQQRGSGLGAVFGGEGSVYRTKRGLEKILFFVSIFFSLIFLVSSFLIVIL